MKSDTSRSDYTAACRAVGNQILLRKVEFYGQVASCKEDQKKLCCLMNNLMGQDSPTSLPSESDIQLALDFSRFFQSKVLRIREELDGTSVHSGDSVEFHPQQSVRSLFLKFNPVDELSIRRYFKNTKNLFIHIARIPIGDSPPVHPNIFKMSPPFASSEGYSASGVRYQSDGECVTHLLPHS